jgi:thiamine transport system ATP-binding protein
VPSSEGLRAEHLATSWGDVPVLRDVSVAIAPGEFVTLLGPNGSGKTTLLRAIAGLEPLRAGRVWLGGRDLGPVPVHRRGIGMLLQEPTMLPRRTVRENVAFGPEIQGLPPGSVAEQVDESLDLLRLNDLADRPADALSGGERQRVALARTLAARPSALLLDEPFAAVDPELRSDLRAEFRRVLRGRPIPILHVTHDREEGMFLGDRVLVLMEGRLVQSGTPAQVFDAPATAAVARFLGYNIWEAPDGPRAVHPTDVTVGPWGASRPRGEIVATGPVGREFLAFVADDEGHRWEIRGASSLPAVGSTVGLRIGRSHPLGPPAKE